MNVLNALSRWIAIRRAQRRWRDVRTILILVLICVLCNVVSLFCGLTGYTLQQLGLLPQITATPLPLP
jgi:hypothetical protein